MAIDPFKERISRAPTGPGCYLWKKQGSVLYIGKARNLRSRLRSYLSHDGDRKTFHLMQEVDDLEWIQTGNVVEALLLEANLIKKFTPRYNIRLKDDKRYPYICVSTGEPYPMVYLTRKVHSAHRIFGPYTDVKSARRLLALIHKIFPIRKTPLKLPLKQPARPCMNFHIKRCLGPCQGNVSVEEYQELITTILLFLEGKHEILEQLIGERIAAYSAQLQFERAALYRDMLYQLRETLSSQSVMHIGSGDFDLLAQTLDGQEGQLVLFEVRGGILLGRRAFPLAAIADATEEELYSAILRDTYSPASPPPENIFIPVSLKETDDLQNLLSDFRGQKTRIKKIRLAEHRKLFDMARENARSLLRERMQSQEFRSRERALSDLKEILSLPEIPRLLECYDVSHTSGSFTVASGIVFREGIPHKQSYRRYRIRQVEGIDDPLSIREVIHRRLSAVYSGKVAAADLYVIDGGPAQLGAALSAAFELKPATEKGRLHMIGLAKKFEEIYLPGKKEPLRLDPNRPALRLLRQMRDEAHRFAITYQRKLRDQSMASHSLKNIEGLGPQKLRSILSALKERSLDELTLADLRAIPGIHRSLAERILKARSLTSPDDPADISHERLN